MSTQKQPKKKVQKPEQQPEKRPAPVVELRPLTESDLRRVVGGMLADGPYRR